MRTRARVIGFAIVAIIISIFAMAVSDRESNFERTFGLKSSAAGVEKAVEIQLKATYEKYLEANQQWEEAAKKISQITASAENLPELKQASKDVEMAQQSYLKANSRLRKLVKLACRYNQAPVALTMGLQDWVPSKYQPLEPPQ